MKLVSQYDPILSVECDRFDFDNPIIKPKELVDGLQKIRKEGRGVGLAAPQVGINTQVLVIGMGDFKSEGVEDFNQAFFNPEITEVSDEVSLMIEGCLSYPGLFVKVKRPQYIVLTWDNEKGKRCYEKFAGMTSRILQHEIDHLNGITFLKRAGRYHLEQAKKELKKLERVRKRNETTSN